MFRLTIRFFLLPLFLLSATLLVIRAQPYENADVRSLLRDDGCVQLCFMGIQPGITTPQDAIDRLRSNKWISRVGVSESLQTVAWYWNQNPSTLLNEQEIPALFYDRDSVSSIRLYTTISLGDLLLAFGETPSLRVAMRRTVPLDLYKIDLYYLGNGYVLNAIVDCHNFWNRPTHLILGKRPAFVAAQGVLVTSLNKAKHLIASLCRLNQQ